MAHGVAARERAHRIVRRPARHAVVIGPHADAAIARQGVGLPHGLRPGAGTLCGRGVEIDPAGGSVIENDSQSQLWITGISAAACASAGSSALLFARKRASETRLMRVRGTALHASIPPAALRSASVAVATDPSKNLGLAPRRAPLSLSFCVPIPLAGEVIGYMRTAMQKHAVPRSNQHLHLTGCSVRPHSIDHTESSIAVSKRVGCAWIHALKGASC